MGFANPVKKLAYNRQWAMQNYRKNKKSLLAKQKIWREENKEKYLAGRRKYFLEHREEIREKARVYYQQVRKVLRKKFPLKTKAKDREMGLKRIKKIRDHIQNTKIALGGKCSLCGYDKEPRILQFHHLNGKSDKIGNISEMKSLRKITEESKKCALLCPNCHALEHLC